MASKDSTIFQPIVSPIAETPTANYGNYTDKSWASAIEGAAKITDQAITKRLTNEATKEFNDSYENFIAREEAQNLLGAAEQTAQLADQTEEFFNKDGETPAEEAVLLEDMKGRVAKWDKAFKQKRISPTEFRVKMESTLKKYINMVPSMAADFRQAAKSSLGFDPTGAEFDAIEAQYNKASKDSLWLTKKLAGTVIDAGLYNNNYSVEQNISTWAPVAARMKRDEKAFDDEVKTYDFLQKRDKNIDMKLSSQQVSFDLHKSGVALKQITKAETPEERKNLVTRLQAQKSEYLSTYLNRYGTNLTYSEIENRLKPINDQIDLAIKVAKGEVDKEILDDLVSANTNSVILGIQGTPKGRNFIAAAKVFKGIMSLPASVQRFLGEGTKEFMNFQADVGSINGERSPFTVIKHSITDPQGQAEAMKWMKTEMAKATDSVDITDPAQMQTYQGYLEGVMVPMFSDPDSVTALEYDTILKTAGNPKFVEIMKNLPNAERVKDKLARVSAAYTTALLKKASADLDAAYQPGRQVGYVTPKSVIRLEKNEEGLVEFVPIESELSKGGELASAARSAASYMNKNFAGRFNDSVKLTAHLRGHTKYGAMVDQMAKYYPELVQFMGKVEDGKE